jgi:hypothetical protein
MDGFEENDMNLNSYLSSWWLYDLGHTIDEDAYTRFMTWMGQPRVVKTLKVRGWRRYTFDMFVEDMNMLGERGSLRKHSAFAISGQA